MNLKKPEDNNNGATNGVKDGKRWEDLYHFKDYLYSNYTVVEKKSSNTDVVNNVEDWNDAVWIIVGVDKEFTSEESSAVRNFVKNGGNFILAAESDYANKISTQFAVEYTNHRIIEADDVYDKSEFFVPLNPYIGGSTYHIITNGPMGLQYDKNVTTIQYIEIASSSEWHGAGLFSFLDLNDNSVADGTDIMGPIPAILEARFGEGRLIFIGDSGLFTDDLWELETYKASYANKAFCQTLIKNTVSKEGTVIYDFSKHENIQSGHLTYPV